MPGFDATERPSRLRVAWRFSRGPLLTALAAVALALLERTEFAVPAPGAPLLLTVAYAGFTGGLLSGLVSAAISAGYVGWFYSAPGSPGVFSTAESLRAFAVVAASSPVIAALGALARRRVVSATRGRIQGEQEFSRALMHAMQDGLTLVRASDRVLTDVNPSFCKLTGFSREDLIGTRPPFPYWPPEDHERQSRVLERALAGEPVEEDMMVRTSNGQRLQMIIDRSPLRDQNGRITAVLGTFKDVTERKRQEAALLASEERYRTITDTASDAIVTIDDQSRILFVNRAAEKVFGYGRAQMVNQPLTMLMPEAEGRRHREGLKRYLETGKRRIGWESIELPGLHRSGAEIPLEVSFGEAVIDGRHLFTGILRDISERRQAHEALRRSEEQLAHAQRMEAVGRLAGGIAHDFNNLLTAITGYTDLLLSDLPAESSMREDLQEIRKTADRASRLTRQLLAFSRRQVMATRVLDVNRVVAELEPMLQRIIGEDVQLVTFLEPRLRRVKSDPGQLEQVVMNLAVNARDAMPAGGLITIETANVEVSEQEAAGQPELRPGRYVMLGVSDTGTGMDAETQEHLFEPFFTTKEYGKGTGLGLATVYGVVTQSEGAIRVYSEPGHGSSFKIYLPDAAEEITPDADLPLAAPMEGTETVLLVEDDPSVRALARQVLQRYGYQALDAPAASQALLIADRHPAPIHLLLSDVVMPEMSGPELAKRLATVRPEMKVLFMSGYSEDAIVDHGVLSAKVEFIQKPFSPEMLARKIRAVLDADTGAPPPAAGDASPATAGDAEVTRGLGAAGD